jgi:acylphosphatase
MEELRAIVLGRVQMVGYRAYVEKHARSLALVGCVFNRTDGSVEVIAQGRREALEALLMFIRKGPFLAKVSDVKMEWRTPTTRYEGFTAGY